ncbi:hypothetical protein GYH30_009532 [Glycine max]|nr:hypothetical protein GYH30_009532 [Glycine max]
MSSPTVRGAAGLSLARTGARALSGGRTGRFQTEGLLDLAGGCGGYGSLERGRVRRVLTRRIGGGVVGSGTERLAGGGAARGDEDSYAVSARSESERRRRVGRAEREGRRRR